MQINKAIKAVDVRLISPQGNQLGVVSFQDALVLAQGAGVDLICISPNANPPVCKIYSYQKWLYEQEKAKKHDSSPKLKEVQFSQNIGEGDIAHKVKHIREFISAGNPVRISLRYSGRDAAHKDIGLAVLKGVVDQIKDIAKVVKYPSIQGNTASAQFAPL